MSKYYQQNKAGVLNYKHPLQAWDQSQVFKAFQEHRGDGTILISGEEGNTILEEGGHNRESTLSRPYFSTLD